ncbi:MAG TPA: HAD family acid phosphatase [Thermoanaerobaculia bacterium]|nr:HAD family acid phosphatase [Thermoanaerobaculia bacterium]
MTCRALILVVVLASGCATAPTPTAAPPAQPAPAATPSQTAPSQAAPAAPPAAIHWVRDSAEHHAALLQAYLLATERIEKLAKGVPAGTWAVALDGDETVIDNSDYMKERAAQGAGFDSASWKQWTEKKAATPLPGAVAFLTRVHELGGKIAIVTNRSNAECPDTEADFRNDGIPYDLMLCMENDSEKEPRWQKVENGTAAPGVPPLRILLWVGDNIKDFPDLDQSLLAKQDSAYSDFGRRFILIPNPMYGSWERNPAR